MGFANTFPREQQSCSVRLYEVPKEGNPTLLRSIEQVSSICTIKSFLCLKLLFNIKLNSERRVWKKFVKKNKEVGQLRQELNVIMDYPVCWVANLFLSILNCSILAYTNIE